MSDQILHETCTRHGRAFQDIGRAVNVLPDQWYATIRSRFAVLPQPHAGAVLSRLDITAGSDLRSQPSVCRDCLPGEDRPSLRFYQIDLKTPHSLLDWSSNRCLFRPFNSDRIGLSRPARQE